MRTNHILLSALLLCATGCTSDIATDESTTNQQDKYPVHFSGGIDMVQTKVSGTTTMGDGVKATIYAYTQGATVTSAEAVAKGEYASDASGNLTANPIMYLAKGNYDFYGVSVNSTTTAPTFTSGVTEVLSNNVDYLWVKAGNQTIENAGKNVDLTFARKAVKVLINIESGDGIELTDWQTTNPAMITPPEPSTTCKMTLADGVIVPATIVNATTTAMANEAVSSQKATVSYIMLPLVDAGSSPVPTITLKVKVKVNGNAAEDRTYTANLGYPTGGFVSGNQYTYKATLKANGITFTGAKVTNWEEQTQSDLTPTEPAS